MEVVLPLFSSPTSIADIHANKKRCINSDKYDKFQASPNEYHSSPITFTEKPDGLENSVGPNEITRNVMNTKSYSSRCWVKSYAGYSLQGYNPFSLNKPNQDRLLMMEDDITSSLIVACFDGHGAHGHIVAQYFKESIETNLTRHPLFGVNIQGAIFETLRDIEIKLYNEEIRFADFSGTTLTIAVIRKDRVVVANIGDSRTVLVRPTHSEQHFCKENHHGRPRIPSMESQSDVISLDDRSGSSDVSDIQFQQMDSVALPITIDHKPDLPAEYYRIIDAGGRVFAVRHLDGSVGPARVWLNHMNVPGLAMSRSLGDFVVHTAGVISTPDFYEFSLSEGMGDEGELGHLVLATDGIWDHVSNEEVACVAAAMENPDEIIQKLITESKDRWLSKENMVDDITLCVVRLQRECSNAMGRSEVSNGSCATC